MRPASFRESLRLPANVTSADDADSKLVGRDTSRTGDTRPPAAGSSRRDNIRSHNNRTDSNPAHRTRCQWKLRHQIFAPMRTSTLPPPTLLKESFSPYLPPAN